MQEKVSSFDWKRALKVSLQASFVLVVFFFLGLALVRSWNKLNYDISDIAFGYLALSFFLFILALLSYALCWNESLSFLGKPLKAKKAVKIWYWSQAARYIPGSVWQIFGRIYFGSKEGISKGKVIASIAIETTMLIISSIVIFALSLPFSKTVTGLGRYWPYFVIAAGCLVFLHPKVFNKTSRFFVHRMDRNANFATQVTFIEILKLLAYYSAVWLVFGLAFFALVLSLKAVEISFLPVFIGIFAVSWVLGFLFVIAPGGIGAREGAIVLMMAPYLGQPLSIVIAVLSRIVMILAEALILVISSRF